MKIDVYLNQESWMMMTCTILNMTIGRVKVSVPCTVLVTAADIYALKFLTPLHTHYSNAVRFYAYKQVVICGLACAVQWCVERLASYEVQSTLEVHKSELYEQLATRLTVSMCDAVVHLDESLHFSKPAEKLAHLLIRRQLGNSPTDFMNLVHAEDKERFKSHLKFVSESADSMEPLRPLHLSLLDASGSRCRVQMFASAYRDDEEALHYILGFGEFQDDRCAPTQQHAARGVDIFNAHFRSGIPEESVVESDGDASYVSSVSSVNRQDQQTFKISICQGSGNIVSVDASFNTFMKGDFVGMYFPSLFHDPPAVWAWLQLKAHCCQADSLSSPQDRSSDAFMLQQSKSWFDVKISVGELVLAHDGMSVVNISLHLGKRHRRKQYISSQGSSFLVSPSETAAISCDVAVRIHAAEYGIALDVVQDLTETIFGPFMSNSWAQWQQWWNECEASLADEPFSSSQGNFSMEATRYRSRKCVSVCLRIPEVATRVRRSPSKLDSRADEHDPLSL
eukprot:TRINITY_DN47734_c0_g1_i1.p1 TRINITY_DN47734_c0_g1~~TRINITY_DN47734_c0_g1_i1.p1  ORF type:complete len:561 (-),score=38.74 TRINITY_DN47734_c0_g1_i1:87-1613(-)